MRFCALSGGALVAASIVSGREMAKNEAQATELYDSGVMHRNIMGKKTSQWLAKADMGQLNSTMWPRLSYTKCIDGKVEAVKGDPMQTFRCKNMDLYDFINHATLGSPNGWDFGDDKIGPLLTGSGSWGWTDPKSGREFIASGMYEGTAMIEILPEGKMLPLGFLPCPAPITGYLAFWKEIRAYKNWMLIGSELGNHGIQIFDMTKLLTIDKEVAPINFDIVTDVASHFMDLPEGASHNIAVNEEGGYAIAVGARPREDACGSGLVFIDLKDPTKPTRIGCNGDDGYVHDAQCLKYRGPHTKYIGREICYGYNEDTLTIYDVTDKAKSTVISITSYEGATYTHQGWVLDPHWQEWLVSNDEFDEEAKKGPAADGYAVTYIWDIRDLEKPKQTGIYKSSVPTVDHNLYIKDNIVYQSSYVSGFRVYDVSSIPEDPTGDSVCEIAYLDIHPEDDHLPGGGEVSNFGTWSSYAMFKSGFIFINTIERGGYLAKITKREKCPKTHPCTADNCLRAMHAKTVKGRLQESQEFCCSFTEGFKADVKLVPTYAAEACGRNIISRVSSACSCLPTATGAL